MTSFDSSSPPRFTLRETERDAYAALTAKIAELDPFFEVFLRFDEAEAPRIAGSIMADAFLKAAALHAIRGVLESNVTPRPDWWNATAMRIFNEALDAVRAELAHG